MTFRSITLFIFCMSAAVASWADTIDFSLSNTSARAELSSALPQKQLGYSIGGIHNTDNGDLVSVGIHVNDRLKASTGGVSTSVGAKLIGFDVKNGPNGSALAIGGYVRQSFAQANLVSIRGDVFYAPRVASFGQADHYLELGARLEYQLVEQASVYVGVRKIKASFNNSDDKTLDNSAQLGLILYF